MNLFSYFQRKRTPMKTSTTGVEYPIGVTALSNDFIYSLNEEILSNPDTVLKNNDLTIQEYEKLLVDSHLSSCVQSRKSGILSMEWYIGNSENKSKESKFIEDIFKKLNIKKIIEEMLDAPLYGFKPVEIYWGEDDGYVIPKDIVGKPSWWFNFDSNNLLRFISLSNASGELIPKKKFVLLQKEATYDNPFGKPVLSKCYYPVIFKKGGVNLWAKYVQKYGIPFIVGKAAIGKTQELMEDFLTMIRGLQQDGAAVIPNDDEVSLLEASHSAPSNVYESLAHYCNSEISKAVLSQTLTTEQGDTGSYAMSQTHLQVRYDVVESDKKMVEEAFNQIIKWIIELNFAGDVEIPEFILYNKTDIDLNLAERDVKLSGIGVKFTDTYFKRNYGLQDDEFEITEDKTIENLNKANSPDIAEKSINEDVKSEDIGGVDKEVEKKPVKKTAKTKKETEFAESKEDKNLTDFEIETQKVIKQIVGLIDEGTDYNEIQDKIIKMFPDLNTNDLEDFLSKSILISTASGVVKGVKK